MDEFFRKVKTDPYAKYLGIQTEKVGKGFARCSIQIKEYMLNFEGTPHGGLIFSLTDVAFSAAACSLHMPATALNVSGTFIKTARVDDTIVAEAKLIYETRRFMNFEITVKHDNDLVSIFHGTAYKIGL